MHIRKAVIPAAGLGTRFLPATKTTPKEMLPIVDKPTILYNVEEILAAGIEQLVLIAGREKTAIEDFFDTSFELEELLETLGKTDLLKSIRDLRKNMQVISVRQKQALGLGHAVLCAKPIVDDEPFAVILGDEIMVTAPDRRSAIGQLVDVYDRERKSVVAVMEVTQAQVHKYGIVDVEKKAENLWVVKTLVEKPSAETAPSRLALPGRYVFDAGIFAHLEKVKPGKNGEIQLTDAMTLLAGKEGLLAMKLDAERFDAGDKLGFLQANVELALKHPEVGPGFAQYLKSRFGAQL